MIKPATCFTVLPPSLTTLAAQIMWINNRNISINNVSWSVEQLILTLAALGRPVLVACDTKIRVVYTTAFATANYAMRSPHWFPTGMVSCTVLIIYSEWEEIASEQITGVFRFELDRCVIYCYVCCLCLNSPPPSQRAIPTSLFFGMYLKLIPWTSFHFCNVVCTWSNLSDSIFIVKCSVLIFLVLKVP